MLPRARFRDNASFTHPFGDQGLANGIIDFMGSSVEQIFPFEINFSPSALLSQAFGKV